MNRKRRVTKTVIMLTFTFIILWFPVHFMATLYRVNPDFVNQHFVFYIIKMIAHTMAYSNASVNPIIYTFSNDSFRSSIDKLLAWFRCSSATQDNIEIHNRNRIIECQKEYNNPINNIMNSNRSNNKQHVPIAVDDGDELTGFMS